MLLKRNLLGAHIRHMPELNGVNLGTIGQATPSNGRRGSEPEGENLMSRAA